MAMMFRNAMKQPAMPQAQPDLRNVFQPTGLGAVPDMPTGAVSPYAPPVAAAAETSGKPNWAGIAADFLAGMAGQQPVFAPIQAREKARTQALQDAETQRQREVADWIAKEQWKRDNPAPVNNDTVADYNFIAQQLGPEAAKLYLSRKGDPIVNATLPNGQFISAPASMVPQFLGGTASATTPTKPVGKLTPIPDGGPTQPASGGFRP